MKQLLLLSVLVLLWSRSSAQKPRRCSSPPLLSGSLIVTAREGKDSALAKYRYDALFERIRLWEFGNVGNQSFYFDMLFLFREGVVYSIDYGNRTCQKNPLHSRFHPARIPDDASLLAQVILGGSSGPGQGLLVNSWYGDVPETKGKYQVTVTEFGCIPAHTLYYTEKTGWITTIYFNAVTGVEDPSQFDPPPFCEQAKLEDKPLDFYSAFLSD